jgi:hypothetical protein
MVELLYDKENVVKIQTVVFIMHQEQQRQMEKLLVFVLVLLVVLQLKVLLFLINHIVMLHVEIQKVHEVMAILMVVLNVVVEDMNDLDQIYLKSIEKK